MPKARPVKFPYGQSVHLGQVGGYAAYCGTQSTAQPKYQLLPTPDPVTCRWCKR